MTSIVPLYILIKCFKFNISVSVFSKLFLFDRVELQCTRRGIKWLWLSNQTRTIHLILFASRDSSPVASLTLLRGFLSFSLPRP